MHINIELFILSLIVGQSIYWGAEFWRRKEHFSNEVSRKLVHSIHAASVAYWPFIMDIRYVIAIEVIFIIGILVAKQLHLFSWLWKVGRTSWGEYAYPIGIISAVLLAETRWIYLAGILILGFADASAALIGKKYGKKNSYMIFGQKKSLAGSAAFMIIASAILLSIVFGGPEAFTNATVLTVLGVAACITAIENLGVYGSDNLGIPIMTVIFLNFLR